VFLWFITVVVATSVDVTYLITLIFTVAHIVMIEIFG